MKIEGSPPADQFEKAQPGQARTKKDKLITKGRKHEKTR
jgi:hypothetical protein